MVEVWEEVGHGQIDKQVVNYSKVRCLSFCCVAVILEGSEAAHGISKSDLVKRMKAYTEKKAKLANQHYFVSKTRLCVMNLPTRVDEKRARLLFQKQAGDVNAKVVQVRITGLAGARYYHV